MVQRLPTVLGRPHSLCTEGCNNALDHNILTTPEHRNGALVAELDAVEGRVALVNLKRWLSSVSKVYQEINRINW
jgi:hypothetical protein